jgi:hypothetical protein
MSPKRKKKNIEILWFQRLDVLLGGLEFSPLAFKPYREALE